MNKKKTLNFITETLREISPSNIKRPCKDTCISNKTNEIGFKVWNAVLALIKMKLVVCSTSFTIMLISLYCVCLSFSHVLYLFVHVINFMSLTFDYMDLLSDKDIFDFVGYIIHFVLSKKHLRAVWYSILFSICILLSFIGT